MRRVRFLSVDMLDSLSKLCNTVEGFLRDHARSFEDLPRVDNRAPRAHLAIGALHHELKALRQTLESQVIRCDAFLRDVSYGPNAFKCR